MEELQLEILLPLTVEIALKELFLEIQSKLFTLMEATIFAELFILVVKQSILPTMGL